MSSINVNMSQDEVDVAASMVAAEVAAMKGNSFGSGSIPPVVPVPGISAEPIVIDGSSGLSSAPGAPDISRPQEEARAVLAAQAEAAIAQARLCRHGCRKWGDPEAKQGRG